MIVITPQAADAVKAAIAQTGKEGAGLRIMVEQGGCAGYRYVVGLDSVPREDDAVIESAGIKVFVDPLSKPLIEDLHVDFVESFEGSGFTFDNPGAAGACGCGKSFSC